MQWCTGNNLTPMTPILEPRREEIGCNLPNPNNNSGGLAEGQPLHASDSGATERAIIALYFEGLMGM